MTRPLSRIRSRTSARDDGRGALEIAACCIAMRAPFSFTTRGDGGQASGARPRQRAVVLLVYNMLSDRCPLQTREPCRRPSNDRTIVSVAADQALPLWVTTCPRSGAMTEPDREFERWRDEYLRTPERDADFETLSGEPLQPLYTPEDVAELDHDRDLGYPGRYPFTRGVYPSMYRGRLWTMRQFAGFGTPEETNRRYKFLLAQGQGGLS